MTINDSKKLVKSNIIGTFNEYFDFWENEKPIKPNIIQRLKKKFNIK